MASYTSSLRPHTLACVQSLWRSLLAKMRDAKLSTFFLKKTKRTASDLGLNFMSKVRSLLALLVTKVQILTPEEDRCGFGAPLHEQGTLSLLALLVQMYKF